jgi:hypothetical protein
MRDGSKYEEERLLVLLLGERLLLRFLLPALLHSIFSSGMKSLGNSLWLEFI